MSTNSETQCLHNDIINSLIRVKLLKCNEFVSLLKSHNDLS